MALEERHKYMKKLAVIFPGIGYHADKPLLYYARKLATEAGYEEQIKIEYTCTQKKIRGDKEKMKKTFEELYAQAECALKDVKWDEYDDVLFISKSIGTVISMTFACRNFATIANTDNNSTCTLRQILYTPLEATFLTAQIVGEDPQEAFSDNSGANNEAVNTSCVSFIGTADPWSNVPDVIALAKKNNIPIHVYDDANHSLETDDTIENLNIIRDVMKKSKIFMN